MADAYIGEIRMLPYTFNPVNWAYCDGRLLQISEYNVLFSILGTTYGGDGRLNFALPDLRGRAPIHAGQSPGVPPAFWGMATGSAQVTLQSENNPQHVHTAKGSRDSQNETDTPTGQYPASLMGYLAYKDNVAGTVEMSSQSLQSTGGQPHENRQPFEVVRFCICLEGFYPPRNP